MNDLLLVPDLVNLVASYLDHASLANCVQVSKAWHTRFIPSLWHSFGSASVHPMRFGLAFWPEVKTAFPLQVPDPHHPNNSTKTIQALKMANPAIYPEYLVEAAHHPSMWTRLFTRQHVSAEELEQMRVTIAKHAHHIRSLTVRSVESFRLFQHVCTNLQTFHMRLDWTWVKQFTGDGVYGFRREILAFVRQQVSTIVALHLHMGMFDVSELRQLIHLAGREQWRHFDVMLADQDYHDMTNLLPNVETAIFMIGSPSGLQVPLPVLHLQLRELEIYVEAFGYLAFAAILRSFPNLQRLVVRNIFLGTFLDLCRDNVGSMLQIGRRALKTNDLVQIFAMLPDLLVIDSNDLDAECWAALAQYCPRLLTQG